MRTEKQHKNIVALSDIRREKQIALSPYGPVRAGLTTSPKTSAEVQLMELLNSLEKIVQDLNYKSFTVYDTFNIAMEEMRAALSDITINANGIEKVCSDCGNDLPVEGQDKCLDCLEGVVE